MEQRADGGWRVEVTMPLHEGIEIQGITELRNV